MSARNKTIERRIAAACMNCNKVWPVRKAFDRHTSQMIYQRNEKIKNHVIKYNHTVVITQVENRILDMELINDRKRIARKAS